MANTSIKAAFERMWQHIIIKLGSKSDIDHTHESTDIVDPVCTSATTSGDGGTVDAFTVPDLAQVVVGSKFKWTPTAHLTHNNLGLIKVNGSTYKLVKKSSDGFYYTTKNALTPIVFSFAPNTTYTFVYAGETYWYVDGGIMVDADDVFGQVPIAAGGTGAPTAEAALANLGGASLKDGLYEIYVTESDSVFSASVPGITELTSDTTFIMIIGAGTYGRGEDSTPWKLNVNGLGAKPIYRTTSSGDETDIYDLSPNFPYMVSYNPINMHWLITNVPKPTKEDIKSSLGIMKELRTGMSWSSGTEDVPNTADYTLFLITFSGQGTSVLAIKNGTHIRGIGGYSTDTPTLLTYQFTATFSGNTWTLVKSNYTRHETDTTAPCHSYVDTTVTGIYGII